PRSATAAVDRSAVAEAMPAAPVDRAGEPDAVATEELATIDDRYAQLLTLADPMPALRPETEDAVVPALLDAGLTAWIAERGPAGDAFSLDPQAGGKPALHARMRCSPDEDS